MRTKQLGPLLKDVLVITLGSAMYALAFSMLLAPNAINAGGVSGLAMVLVQLFDFGSVGLISVLINIPLFIAGYRSVGKKFFFGSLLGMVASSLLIDVFARLPVPETEPLLGAAFGGLLSGVGIGMVFTRGASTGGVDIVARLLKKQLRDLSIGKLMLFVDGVIIVLTGIAFRDLNIVLYCAVSLYLCTVALDGVVYGFEYSKVALIISDHYEQIVENIDKKLDRGATYLKGEGSYERTEKMIVLCAVKRDQLAALKDAVVEVDPDAFVIVQEAHQVLGYGFDRYSKDSL